MANIGSEGDGLSMIANMECRCFDCGAYVDPVAKYGASFSFSFSGSEYT